MRISHTAAAAIRSQPPERQAEILAALEEIEADPLSGTYLPVPYLPGTIGWTTENFVIVYRMTDDQPEIASITEFPDLSQAW